MLYCKGKDINYICIPILIGRVAEWLGRGLQNLLQRFESALDLNKKAFATADAFFMCYFLETDFLYAKSKAIAYPKLNPQLL